MSIVLMSNIVRGNVLNISAGMKVLTAFNEMSWTLKTHLNKIKVNVVYHIIALITSTSFEQRDK